MMCVAITHAAWLKAKETQALIAALETARPGGSRFVGGCVRNTLMGREVDDIDIATQLTPDQVTEVATKAGFAAHPTGIEHGTVTVVVNSKPFEVTTLRRDVSTDGRRATVAFTESWEEDAAAPRLPHERALRLGARARCSIPPAAASTMRAPAASSSSATRTRASAKTISASCASSASTPGTPAARSIRTGSTPAPISSPASTSFRSSASGRK